MTTFSQVNGYIHKKFFRYRLHQKTSEIDRILNPAQLKNAVSHIVAVEVTAMQYGTLIVEVTVAQQALPIEGAAIIVTNDDQTVNLRLSSGANGKSPVIRIEAPDRELSLNPDNQTKPYAQVHVTVSKADVYKRQVRAVVQYAVPAHGAGIHQFSLVCVSVVGAVAARHSWNQRP